MSTKKYEVQIYNYKFTQQSADSSITFVCQQRMKINIEEIKTEPNRKHAQHKLIVEPPRKNQTDLQCNMVSSSSYV